MTRGLLALLLFGGLVLGVVAWDATGGARAANDGIMPAQTDLAAGERLYADYCASCHGANLEGQPNWQSPGDDGRLPAPPHDQTGHTWHHSDQVLFTYTKLGGREALAAQGVDFDSGMPSFAEQLSDQDIWDILAYIKSTWPERVQEVQAARTAAEAARPRD